MVHFTIRLVALGFAAVSLTACVETGPTTSTPMTSVPTAAEQACLAAVSRSTNSGDVVLLGSEFSQAGTFVRVGVGAQRAPWKCIAYRDGTTGEIEYMGMNG